MALQNRTYKAGSLRRREFCFPAHVHITGNVDVGTMFVPGDLTVEGNLVADRLYCLGKVAIGGNLKAEQALLGPCVQVEGKAIVDLLTVGAEAAIIGRTLLGVQPFDEAYNALMKNIHPDVVENHLQLKKIYKQGDVPALTTPTFVGRSIDVQGSAIIREPVNAEYVDIAGNLNVPRITVKKHVHVDGTLYCDEDIIATGQCIAAHLVCHGNIEADEIIVSGEMTVRGYVEANRVKATKNIQVGSFIAVRDTIRCEQYLKVGRFVVADDGVFTGDDYGILAGLCVARTEWQERGYVCSGTMPRNILTGVFNPDESLSYSEAWAEE